MTDKPTSLRDVARALERATEALDEIQRRTLYEQPPRLGFEQKVVAAARGIDNGDQMKDYLASDEIEQAIRTLADVYTVTGVMIPQDWY